MSSDPLARPEPPPPWRASLGSVPRPERTHNEDLAEVVGSSAWVLDGASVRDPSPSCCTLGARWYVQRLSAALAATLNPSSPDLSAALAAAISQVAAEHDAACSETPCASAPSAAVAIVRRLGDVLDYLVLGDASVLLGFGGTVECLSDKRLGLVAPELRGHIRNHLATGGGYEDPEYARLLDELVAAERAVRNTEGGYWIASLDPGAAGQSLTGSLPIGPDHGHLKTAALLSDGVSRSVTHLHLYRTWGDLLDALLHAGPQACIDAIRRVERADPHGRRFPRTAPSDDASAIALRLVA